MATYFPIRTATACQLKWNWTTLYLDSGVSKTCHRTAETALTPENFNNFHNTEIVLDDRRRMLQGLWPEKSCSYCKNLEESGGFSDRRRHLDIPNLVPPELDNDATALEVSPTIVEVFFNNTCNLGCLYCSPYLSSVINNENQKFGSFIRGDLQLTKVETHHKDLTPYFWQWFVTGFPKLKRFGALGGEPLYQKEFEKLLDMIEQYPNSDCELCIVTNLMVGTDRLRMFIDRFKKLILTKKVKKIDITCSIDCWGPQQEYVRWGLQIHQWQKNFEILLDNKWLYLNINQTITGLTIKTMPELLTKIKEWNSTRTVHQHFSIASPGPTYLDPGVLGGDQFKDDFDQILNLMPQVSDEDKTTYNYMASIASKVVKSTIDVTEVVKLLDFLDEKDRRRGTHWPTLFPWLTEYKKYVV